MLGEFFEQSVTKMLDHYMLCHKLLSPFLFYPGLFHRKIPPEIALIRLEWN